MVPEEGSENIRTRSVGNSPSPDFRSIRTYARASDEHEATHERGSITRKIPSRNALISIAVIDEHSFTRESITRSLQALCNLLDIASFATCDECLGTTRNFDLVLYHSHESLASQDNSDDRLSSVKKIVPIAPVIILCDVDSFDSIRAAFDSGVRAYIPTASTTLALAIEIMYLVNVGGTFVPPSSLSPRRIGPQGTPNTITTQQFTPRQMAVLDLVKRGKTNKIIAYELGMSESSVKTHIGNIMKKMNATNRTEVVCRAHELATSGTQSTNKDASLTNDRLFSV